MEITGSLNLTVRGTSEELESALCKLNGQKHPAGKKENQLQLMGVAEVIKETLSHESYRKDFNKIFFIKIARNVGNLGPKEAVEWVEDLMRQYDIRN